MDDRELEMLLKARGAADPGLDEAVAALRAEAPWPEAFGRRLETDAREALRAAGARGLQAVLLRVRALGRRLEAVVGGGVPVLAADVRGDAPSAVLLQHPFGDQTATTHVALVGARFEVMIDFGLASVDVGTRASLRRGGRELASEVLRQGRWLLPALREGAYEVVATDRSGKRAQLDLVLETLPE